MDDGGEPAGHAHATWLASVRQSLEDVAAAPDAQARLAAVARLERYTDRLTAELVVQARAGDPPLSWARIGLALGITRQAANERFSEAGQRGAVHRRYRRARRMERLRAPGPAG